MKHYFAFASALLALAAASPSSARPMTETDLATMKRLAAPTVSPDGKLVAYQLQETDLAANKRRADIWLMRTDDAEAAPYKIGSKPDKNEHDPAFSPDGLSVYYISNESGSDQIWRFDWQTEEAMQVSDFKTDVSGFKFSPDGRKIVVWGDIARDCHEFGCEKDGDLAKPGPGSGREYDRLFVRHWDSWETPGNYSRAFAFGIGKDGKLYAGHPLDGDGAEAVTGDTPSKPMGGGEEIGWGAGSETVYFALRKADRNEPLSTNLDIYAANQDKGGPANLTEANKATDTLPAASPDGKWLAWAAMARPGYEADRQVLMLRDLKTGQVKPLTQQWDRSVAALAWALDSKSLLVTAPDTLEHPLFRVDLKGKVTRLTERGNVAEFVPVKGGGVLYAINSVTGPSDLVLMDAKGKTKKLTDVNGKTFAALDPVNYSKFDFTGANGDRVYGQIVKPANASGRLPVLFVVHGGPQGSFGNGWSYRWNPAVMASQGYAVVSVDFHGSTGYGQAFTDSINKNWGGWPLEDLKLGLAAAAKTDPQIDADNACALGASYGGYMMNWIEGQWPDRFKCIVQHDGVFDARAMAYETEELWFDEWEHGGPYFKVPQEFEKWNPVNYVDRWKTPMLVITSEKDFRIPYTQGIASFTALQRREIESKLLVFPDENHWVLKPQNSIQWHRAVFDWVGKHLKGK